jgi:hypothetical protein
MILALLALAPAAGAAPPPPLRRIEIVEEDNRLPSPLAALYPVDAESPSSLAPLRAYVSARTDLDGAADPDVVVRALEWVSTQWKHDGMNEARPDESALDILKDVHERGVRYRCVEYGKVLSAVLKSFGYATRRVSLRSAGAAYGGFGQGHVATEVWSNALRKWVFIDPQFSVYPTYGGAYLNYGELYELKRRGKWDEIEFHVTPGFQAHEAPFDRDGYVKSYKEFLSAYFGYVGAPVRVGARDETLMLLLDGKEPFATFQGLPASDLVFTTRPEDLYFDLDRTVMIFDYAQKGPDNFQQTMERLGIKDDEGYRAQMSRFAAVPDFVVGFADNSPWHSHYEYRLSPRGVWIRLGDETLRWTLRPGENYLAARSVNQAGVPGPDSFVRMTYR